MRMRVDVRRPMSERKGEMGGDVEGHILYGDIEMVGFMSLMMHCTVCP